MAKRKPLSRDEVTAAVKAKCSDMARLSGSKDPFFSCYLTNLLCGLHPQAEASVENEVVFESGAIGALASIAPKDAAEAMLAVQMIGLFEASAGCLRRAALTDSWGRRDRELQHATKLAGAYGRLLELLDRRRGRGAPQVVRVERVNVEPGAQAVVGVVTPAAGQGAGGGGGNSKSEERAHVQAAAVAIADAHEPPLRCADEGRDPMPSAGSEGPQPVPEARRRRR